MAIKDKDLARKDSLSIINQSTSDTSKYLQEMSERYPNSNIKSSAGSMIIHLHSKDQNILTVNNLNKNSKDIKEADFEECMEKHFPAQKKENKENTENTADESTTPNKAANAASERVANFIKNSIKKKIQYNYNNNTKKEEEQIRKPLTEYNIKKIMLKNFSIEPN